MNKATLVYIVDPETKRVLMAKKARKVGTGFWFGYGGKKRWWQSPRGNAKAEIWEETGGVKRKRRNPDEDGGIKIRKKDLEPTALIDFYNGSDVLFGQPTFRVLCYRLQKFTGRAISTEEMIDPTWFLIEALPFGEMKPGDELFVPEIIEVSTIKGWLRFSSGPKKEVLGYSFSPCSKENLIL